MMVSYLSSQYIVYQRMVYLPNRVNPYLTVQNIRITALKDVFLYQYVLVCFGAQQSADIYSNVVDQSSSYSFPPVDSIYGHMCRGIHMYHRCFTCQATVTGLPCIFYVIITYTTILVWFGTQPVDKSNSQCLIFINTQYIFINIYNYNIYKYL